MEFASKCSIFKLLECGVENSKFDKRLISIDRVTNMFLFCKQNQGEFSGPQTAMNLDDTGWSSGKSISIKQLKLFVDNKI